MFKFIITILLLVPMTLSLSAQIDNQYAGIISINKQCMLSQRVAKAYLAQHCLKDNNQALFIKGSFESFKMLQQELLESNTNKNIADQLEHMEGLWDVYSFFIDDDYDSENAASTIEMSDKLTTVCNGVIKMYVQDASLNMNTSSFIAVVGEAGSLSTLANMMMIRIMSYSNKIGMEEVTKKQYLDLKNSIGAILKELKAFKQNSTAITAKVDEVNVMWTNFFKIADSIFETAPTLNVEKVKGLLVEADYISKMADELASMYEVLAMESIKK